MMKAARRMTFIGAALALHLLFPALVPGQGKTLWSVTSFGQSDYFQDPSDIEVDTARGLIYVVDAGSSRVLVFNDRGEFLRVIGNKGQGPGEFLRPTGACLAPDGGLAVADVGNQRIQMFDAAGKLARSITVTDARVADLVIADGRFYTVPSFGASNYSITMGSDDKSQPLVNILDDQGKRVLEISVDDFPETHPFVRAIKHRVTIALSPNGKLYLPFFAMNLIHVFEKTGKKVAGFSRPLPFKPIVPALMEERSPEKGVVQMRATLDFVSIDAEFGPDGRLYILTATDSLAERTKKPVDQRGPAPMRVDVIDPENNQAVASIACDPGARAFGLLGGGRLVYIAEDAEGELALKCVRT